MVNHTTITIPSAQVRYSLKKKNPYCAAVEHSIISIDLKNNRTKETVIFLLCFFVIKLDIVVFIVLFQSVHAYTHNYYYYSLNLTVQTEMIDLRMDSALK